jgi:hypothetical protein
MMHHPSRTLLEATTRPDATSAVQEAMEATKKFGPTSKEARVAWDIVEEMDSSDISPAIASTVVSLSPQEVSKLDYYNQIHFLASLLEDTNERLNQMKYLLESIQSLELQDPSLSKLEGNEDLKKALAEAKAAVEVHGAGSEQAMEAWRQLEECSVDDTKCGTDSFYRYSAAALKAHHYYNAVMDTSLLQEAIGAFDTINGLRNYVQVEKNRLDKSS